MANRRVEVTVSNFMELSAEVKKGAEVERDAIFKFLRSIVEGAAFKLMRDHKDVVDENSVCDALDRVLRWNLEDKKDQPSLRVRARLYAKID